MANKKEVKKDENKLDEYQKRKIGVVFLILLVTALVIFGFVYVWLAMDQISNGDRVISTDLSMLVIEMEEGSASKIVLKDTYPMNEAGGLNTKPIKFSLINNGDTAAKYVIKLVEDEDAKNNCENTEGCKIIPISELNYTISKDAWTKEISSVTKDKNNLDMGIVEVGEANKISYMLKIWVDEDTEVDINDATFFGKLVIESR